ncbi:MAG TPA: TlpA disulfide reductase family protein, partial [Kofleriaceae bacterium]|nr:TlpA disulfide reductase family protein [Kofleriaceae bacterium]
MKTAIIMVLALDLVACLASCAASPPAGEGAGSAAAPAPAAAAARPPGATASASPGTSAASASIADSDGDVASLGYYPDGDPHVAAARDRKCPGAADGSELVGRPAGEWHLTGWANTNGESPTLASLRGRVVVIRFWTVGCPYCEATMPALEKLSEELRDQPVTFVGAFHAKPESSDTDLKRPLEVIRDWKIRFPLAVDRQWQTLREWWLDSGHRHASSVTFVIGKDGKV